MDLSQIRTVRYELACSVYEELADLSRDGQWWIQNLAESVSATFLRHDLSLDWICVLIYCERISLGWNKLNTENQIVIPVDKMPVIVFVFAMYFMDVYWHDIPMSNSYWYTIYELIRIGPGFDELMFSIFGHVLEWSLEVSPSEYDLVGQYIQQFYVPKSLLCLDEIDLENELRNSSRNDQVKK